MHDFWLLYKVYIQASSPGVLYRSIWTLFEKVHDLQITSTPQDQSALINTPI